MSLRPENILLQTIRVLCVAVALFILFDQTTSGQINKKATLTAINDASSKKTVILPYLHFRPKYNKKYVVDFDIHSGLLSHYYIHVFETKGCVTNLRIDDEIQAVISRPNCNTGYFPIRLAPGELYHLRAEITDNHALYLGVSLRKMPIISYGQSLFILCLISILFLASFWLSQSRSLRFQEWVIFLPVFIITLFPAKPILGTNRIVYNDPHSLMIMLAVCAAAILSSYVPYINHLHRWLFAFFRSIGRISARALVPLMMFLFAGLTASIAYWHYGAVPHVADTHAQLVHAKMVAHGYFSIPSHPLKEFFTFQGMTNRANYHSGYPIGHVLLLALGVLIDASWLVNPILSGLQIGMVYLLTYELANRRTAYIASALTCISPFIMFMSASYMNHVSTMLALTCMFYAYIRFVKTGMSRFAVMAGIALGFAFITRPQVAIPFSTPLLLHACWLAAKQRHYYAKHMLYFASGVFSFIALMAIYVIKTYGYTMVFMGFNPLDFITPFFTLERWFTIDGDILRATQQTQLLHTVLLGWPAASLVGVLLLFMCRIAPSYAGLLALCCLAQVTSLILHEFHDSLYGPRYLYETSVFFIILTAIFIRRFPLLLYKWRGTPVRQIGGALAMITFVMMGMAYHKVYLPSYYNFYQGYWEGNANYYHMVMAETQKPALVFVRKYHDFRNLYFTLPPWDKSPLIVAQDLGKWRNSQLENYYDKRHVYMLDGWNIKPYSAQNITQTPVNP